MALISSEPQTIGDMAARVAALEDKYVVVIDNTAYHSMTADEKTAMYNYYKSVDSNGDPKYQVMDNSRLVPVLTAALKEAIAKIETLETKVAALEGS